MSRRKTPPIVRYNVGGRTFHISCELVARHPFTKLADMSAWDDDSKSIFMDGNSERFEYVLDYVRIGEVVLPSTISKAALLRDLQYYGFQNVPPNAVVEYNASAGTVIEAMNVHDKSKEDPKTLDDPNTVVAHSASLGGTMMEAMNLCDQYKKDMKTLDAEIARLQYKRSCFSVAEECFHRCMKNGVGVNSSISLNSFNSMRDDVNRCFQDLNETVLNEQLALYGLYVIRHERAGNQLWLGKVSERDHQARVPNDKTMHHDLDSDRLGGLIDYSHNNECCDEEVIWPY